jgi:hypothetical protein
VFGSTPDVHRHLVAHNSIKQSRSQVLISQPKIANTETVR